MHVIKREYILTACEVLTYILWRSKTDSSTLQWINRIQTRNNRPDFDLNGDMNLVTWTISTKPKVNDSRKDRYSIVQQDTESCFFSLWSPRPDFPDASPGLGVLKPAPSQRVTRLFCGGGREITSTSGSRLAWPVPAIDGWPLGSLQVVKWLAGFSHTSWFSWYTGWSVNHKDIHLFWTFLKYYIWNCWLFFFKKVSISSLLNSVRETISSLTLNCVLIFQSRTSVVMCINDNSNLRVEEGFNNGYSFQPLANVSHSWIP